jgi:hypothetical protein
MTNVALTGPIAAALLDLDGFRDMEWPVRWCKKRNIKADVEAFEVRKWRKAKEIDGLSVANPVFVLRHLARCSFELLLAEKADRVSPVDRVELALEDAIRKGLVDPKELFAHGGANLGDNVLRSLLVQRGDEPPTESYAETRALQLFRSWGFVIWRQVPVVFGGRIKHRVDFVLAYDPKRKHRPRILDKDHGLIVEIDSRKFHEQRFEEDHERESTYDRLGYHWVSFTPNQIEKSQNTVLAAITGARSRRVGTNKRAGRRSA